jgi:hypothetical protein
MFDPLGEVRKIATIEGRPARTAAAVSLAVLAVHWALVLRFVAVRAGNLSFLRLHDNVAFGIDWYDRWWFIFTFPIVGLAFFCFNAWMASALSRVRPAFGTMIHFATVLLEVTLAAAGALALLLNS